MDQVVDVLVKMIVRGSDDLVMALYGRIRADELVAGFSSPQDVRARTWRELADLAVEEGSCSPPRRTGSWPWNGSHPGRQMRRREKSS